jgi:hypothetical protein
MISFTGSLKVFIAVEPIDMRAGFEKLCGAVSENLASSAKTVGDLGLWEVTQVVVEGYF